MEYDGRFAARAFDVADDRVGGPRRGMIGAIALLAVGAFGVYVWSVYAPPESPPLVSAPAGPFKTAAPADVESLTAAAETDAPAPPLTVSPPITDSAAELAPTGEAPPPAKEFAPPGAYLVQLAAVRSRPAAEQAWMQFSSLAPSLFAGARQDIERADLGPQGIFFRLRAGPFSNRESAARFCESVKAAGQDCMVTAR